MQIHDGNKIINLRDITGIKTAVPALPPEKEQQLRLMDITGIKTAVPALPPEKEQQLRLIDLAAKGSIEAAADLAEGYWKGAFGEAPNREKAHKWAKYAAKRGNEKARQLLSKLEN